MALICYTNFTNTYVEFYMLFVVLNIMKLNNIFNTKLAKIFFITICFQVRKGISLN